MSSRFALRLAPLLVLFASLMPACNPHSQGPSVTCYPDKGCFDQYGNQCDADGKNCVSVNGGSSGGSGSTTGTATGTTGTTTGGPVNTGPIGGGVAPVCNCNIVVGDANSLTADNDGDCLPNSAEHGSVAALGNPNRVHSGDPNVADTDSDGIRDGCEDKNHNGLFDANEEDPTSADTDGDGLPDGIEDANKNGVQDYGETNATASDTDHDGILDGKEDLDHDGKVKAWVDVNNNGKFDPGVDTAGESDPRLLDTDADGVPDQLEDKNTNGVYDANATVHETIAWMVDTDGDGIPDGKEDKNHNGAYDAGETDPTSTDTDGDGLADGLEDLNHNGIWDANETNPTLVDTDNDGIPDGVEDRNQNGSVDQFVDSNANGCWDDGETQGESDPRKIDTDGDGIADGVEDRNQNGLCDAVTAPDPLHPGSNVRTYTETCAWRKDTDCDGLAEKAEDKNANGSVDTGETDPRRTDSDYDGLADGCTTATVASGCEDKNNNGAVDAGETDPTRPDSDGDGLPDGCEFNFGPNPPAGGTNPLSFDTDNDGYADPEEDLNHNCVYEPNLNETDPRVANPAPASNANGYAQWSVCAPDNLNGLTYAASARPNQDFRLAFEVEKTNTRGCSASQACPAGQTCVNGNCLLTASYMVQPYGQDTDGGGFNPDNFNDTLWGYVFQSPQGIVTDAASNTVLSRDIYGFVRLASGNDVDQVLEGLRTQIIDLFGAPQVTTGTTLTSRAAFDSTANFPVYFAQRDLELSLQNPNTALVVRNQLLNRFLNGATPQPLGTPPTVDPVYGSISTCSVGVPHCYTNFRLKIGAVQRKSQTVDGAPFIILVLALTPDDSNAVDATAKENRFFADRLTRLEDLTGGSAVARFAASTGKACDHQPQTLARADMLWVVDDSRSMQAIIGRVDQATKGAIGVLKANTNIVDVRVGMTTTNPSKNSRTQCPVQCSETCYDNGTASANTCTNQCPDQALGCIKACPDSCMYSSSAAPSCTGGQCVCHDCGNAYASVNPSIKSDCCSGDGCVSNSPGPTAQGFCYDPASLAGPGGFIEQDLAGVDHMLPGAGGTFFYESTHFMDCDAGNDSEESQKNFLNRCNLSPYAANTGVAVFRASGVENGGVLTKNAGMLHADPNAVCPTSPLTLFYDASNPNSAANLCANSPTDPQHPCCDRLVNSCSDGASVLSSQMCDLIRQMGGVSGLSNNQPTSSARRHSAPEMGTRSARRLLQTMLPAYPYNLSDPTSPLYDPNAVKHLRRSCAAATQNDPNCWTCDPTQNANCKIYPLATVILSDEEDFWLKDECQRDETSGSLLPAQTKNSMKAADRAQLTSGCYYVDGNPNTLDTCTVSYCSGFFGGSSAAATIPTGYNPDQTAMNPDPSYTLAYTSPTAPQCQGTNPNNCLLDPCPDLGQSDCTNLYGSQCLWNPSYTPASGPAVQVGGCHNRCTMYVYDTHPASYAAQQAACVADSQCRWDQSQVLPGFQDPNSTLPGPCVPKLPPNDCQPCKRYLREREAVVGSSGLVGFGNIGPVFALTRNPNDPGRGNIGGFDIDACRGGYLTWGHGDGAAYRDIAVATNGGTYDVCSADYGEFMQTITSQLAVLSIPYPLSGAPIAATIKVGLSRSNGDGTYTYVPVPRSSTSGFLYDATSNSVGFKSDPVDGVCGPGDTCAADGNITSVEIKYASNANTVPRTGDVVYISYRVWDPIPCGGDCPAGQSCAQVICRDDGSSCGGSCTGGEKCAIGQCCTQGTIVQACVDTPNCGQCQDYNSTTHKCENQDPSKLPAGTCPCNPGQTATCNPNGSNTCSLGFACNETCVCEAVPGCAPGTFKADGTVTSCSAALACCNNFATNAAQCGGGKTQSQCTSLAPNCVWRNNSCQYAYQTCCTAGSTAACSLDPESGVNSVYCVPAACSCETKGCESLSPSQECDPGNNCSCYTNGT